MVMVHLPKAGMKISWQAHDVVVSVSLAAEHQHQGRRGSRAVSGWRWQGHKQGGFLLLGSRFLAHVSAGSARSPGTVFILSDIFLQQCGLGFVNDKESIRY